MFGLGASVLALGRWRLPPLPLAFALAFSATVTMLCLLVFVPEIRTPTLMLLALLPPAVALFLPWGLTVQAGWLLAGASVLAVVSVASARGAVPAADWFGAGLVLAISGLASLVGSLGIASLRRRAFEHQMEARRAHARTVAREGELERLNGALALVTRKDPLTGPGNRRRLDEELTAAAALVASARATDTVCRFGGDEFVVLMPEQTLEGAAQAVERIRRAVEDLQLRYPTPSGPHVLTISAGVALLGRSAAHDEDEVLRQADAELYRARRAGRDLGGGVASLLDGHPR